MFELRETCLDDRQMVITKLSENAQINMEAIYGIFHGFSESGCQSGE